MKGFDYLVHLMCGGEFFAESRLDICRFFVKGKEDGYLLCRSELGNSVIVPFEQVEFIEVTRGEKNGQV